MAKCPKCDRSGLKKFKGFCCKAHYKLSRKSQKLRLFCEGCGALQIRNPSEVSKSGIVYCRRCKRPKGESHAHFQGYQTITPGGYRRVLVNGKYQLEHRVNWELANNACLLPCAPGAIHHIDFISSDKLNNDPNNLLLLSHTEHGHLHRSFDNGHYEQVVKLLFARAKEQAFYPKGVDTFIEEFIPANFY